MKTGMDGDKLTIIRPVIRLLSHTYTKIGLYASILFAIVAYCLSKGTIEFFLSYFSTPFKSATLA